jgi:Protein of unknown function (DUF4238)
VDHGVRLGRIRKSSARNEAAVTDYNRHDDSDGGDAPELAEQAFSEIETLARPVLDKVSAGQALTPREWIALAAFLQMQHQRTPRMRENMRFVREQAARLWAQVKLSDREHVREFLQMDGRTVTDEEADAWRSDISKMIDSGQITHRPGWNHEVLGQFAMAEDLPARLCAQVTFPVDRKTCLLLQPGPDRWYEIRADAAMVRDLNLSPMPARNGSPTAPASGCWNRSGQHRGNTGAWSMPSDPCRNG